VTAVAVGQPALTPVTDPPPTSQLISLMRKQFAAVAAGEEEEGDDMTDSGINFQFGHNKQGRIKIQLFLIRIRGHI
jgi:hypothetical protein